MDVERVRKLVLAGKTYEEISSMLREEASNLTRGLSARSVRRFCNEHKINKKSLFDKKSLANIVKREVDEVNNKIYFCFMQLLLFLSMFYDESH